ncbi:MAG: hypothetical protein WC919_00190 [Candidatus Paceibacterota bacterium]|jgi:hypothetical protein
MTTRTPKVEILFEHSLCGERINECDFVDYLDDAVKIALKNPSAKSIVVDVDGLGWDTIVTFFVIYKKLDGVKRVTNRDVIRAIQDMHEGQ